MIPYILLVILLLLVISRCNNKLIEYFPNPEKAGAVNNHDLPVLKTEEGKNINDSMIYNKNNFEQCSYQKNLEKIKNKNLISTTINNNKKLLEYEDKLEETIDDMIQKEIDNQRVILSIIPSKQLEVNEQDDYILGFDENVPLVVTRTKKNISNICTGYWEDWIDKENCKKNTPCARIYRKWSYNNLGDNEEHDCMTDRSGISNISQKINLEDYKRVTFDINKPDDYPTNVDVARCNQVFDYSQKFDITDGSICSNNGKCTGDDVSCSCTNNSDDPNCKSDNRDDESDDNSPTPTPS